MASLFSESKKTSRIHNPRHQPEMLAHKVKYKNALQLARDIGPMNTPGARVFAVIDGSFIFGDFIEAFLVTHNMLAKRMIISTLSLSQENVDSLKNLIIGDYLHQLDIVVSDYFYSHERHSLINYMYEHLDTDNRFQLAVCRTHTKICLIETECGQWFTIHGSANLRSSDNIEMFEIENDKALYDFNAEWHDEIINKYQTINKMVRSLDTWQADQAAAESNQGLLLTAKPEQQNALEPRRVRSKAW